MLSLNLNLQKQNTIQLSISPAAEILFRISNFINQIEQ